VAVSDVLISLAKLAAQDASVELAEVRHERLLIRTVVTVTDPHTGLSAITCAPAQGATLASGATLLIRPPGPMPTPTAFLAWARGEKATVLDLPTA